MTKTKTTRISKKADQESNVSLLTGLEGPEGKVIQKFEFLFSRLLSFFWKKRYLKINPQRWHKDDRREGKKESERLTKLGVNKEMIE